MVSAQSLWHEDDVVIATISNLVEREGKILWTKVAASKLRCFPDHVPPRHRDHQFQAAFPATRAMRYRNDFNGLRVVGANDTLVEEAG
jgi:hypothetical protein